MKSAIAPYLQVFRNRRIATMVLLGFSSGIPLALTAGTLQAWMTVEGIDLKTIGIFALASQPYSFKFIWAPLMDRYTLPWLGRRRGWILVLQIALLAAIALLGFSSPKAMPWTVAGIALCVAFFSASQDIVIDAYRADLLHAEERGVGAAVFVLGYRIAMLVSGALALILSDRIGWHQTYLVMAGCMAIGICATFFGPEPEQPVFPPQSLAEAVWGPLKDFFSRRGAFLLLLFVVLYKLGDAYAGTLTTPFLIRGSGFTPTEVGAVNKGFGMIATIVGAVFGGTLMVRLGLFRSLLLFGILQAVSNLSFMVLAWLGKNYSMMIFAVGFENLSGGMGTAAFVALLMSLCNQRFSTTQYALLSSLASVGRNLVAPSSGFLVEWVGWPVFFLITAITALPGIGMLWWVKKEISGQLEAPQKTVTRNA